MIERCKNRLFLMKIYKDQKIVLVMLGAPGAGKGTQAYYLSNILQIPQISTGNLLRENLSQNSTEQKTKQYINTGQLVPDQIVMNLLWKRLKEVDCQKGYILDGFPRTVSQAEMLDTMIHKTEFRLIVISLEVPDELIVERVSGRIICKKCGAPYHKITNPSTKEVCEKCGEQLIQRKDDTKIVVLERLKVFHQQTQPVKDYYAKKGDLVLIDGALPINKIHCQIKEKLESAL
ncbi:MAG: adenylate kinase [Chlamydiales bacterium]